MQSRIIIDKALQSKDKTLDKSVKLLNGLCTTLQKMRNEGFNSEIQYSEKIAGRVGIELGFPDKRNRKKRECTSTNQKIIVAISLRDKNLIYK